jgi:hypothetical protein
MPWVKYRQSAIVKERTTAGVAEFRTTTPLSQRATSTHSPVAQVLLLRQDKADLSLADTKIVPLEGATRHFPQFL